MNQLLERNKKQRKARKVDTSISNDVFGSKVRPQVGTRVSTPHETGHLDHLRQPDQTAKPSRRSTPRTVIADTYLMQAATDGKMTGVDGHCPTDSWGHKFSGFQKTGLAGNKLHTTVLSTHPDSVLGPQHRMQVPPESVIPAMEEMHTQEVGTWKYTQPEWC